MPKRCCIFAFFINEITVVSNIFCKKICTCTHIIIDLRKLNPISWHMIDKCYNDDNHRSCIISLVNTPSYWTIYILFSTLNSHTCIVPTLILIYIPHDFQCPKNVRTPVGDKKVRFCKHKFCLLLLNTL